MLGTVCLIVLIVVTINLCISTSSLVKEVNSLANSVKTLKSQKGQNKYIVSSYFDKDDTEKNKRYCGEQKDKRLNVARFTKEGEFIECINW